MVALVDITAGTVEAGTGITGGSPPRENICRVGGSTDDGGRPPSWTIWVIGSMVLVGGIVVCR